MEFWDRERESEYLKRYIKSEPNAILFVYGPKSSGKSTLLIRVLEDIKTRVNLYYCDLKMIPVSSYQDVLESTIKIVSEGDESYGNWQREIRESERICGEQNDRKVLQK